MNWLITGGCGFLGTNLVRELLSSSDNAIRIVDNLSVGTRNDLAGVCAFDEIDANSVSRMTTGVQLLVADIRDAAVAVNAVEGIDIVVHFGANTGVDVSVTNPRKDCESNVLGTFNYLEAGRLNDIRRFVFASSGAPAGNVEPPIHEELAAHPVSPYGASKLAGEGYCSAYFQSFGVETVALRFGNVYGPGSTHKNSVVAKFIKRALDGIDLEIFGDGNQTRDFVYIDDLIAAVMQAAQFPGVGGEIFQIAANTETTINDLAERIVELMSEFGVAGVNISHRDPRIGDVKRNYSDISKAKRRLEWQPAHTLDAGLKKTIEFFLAQEEQRSV